MRNKEKRPGRGLMNLGLLLVAAALFLSAYNLYDGLRAGREADAAREQLMQKIPAEGETESPADYILNPDMEMPTITIEGREYIGVLRLSTLGLELPVISQCTDAGLKSAPCRYSGSAYQSDFVICGHNYRTHFSGLKKMKADDRAEFIDVRGNRFVYKVTEVEIHQPEDVKEMKNSGADLTLFTCTPGGKTRYTVRLQKL